MSLGYKYPYGYFYRSSSNLVDVNGNYYGSYFKIPVFLDTIILNNLSGRIWNGNYLIERNGIKYTLIPGEERPILAEPGDSFRFLIENGKSSNSLYNYQIGFRFANIYGDIELSESSQSVSESSSVSSSSSSIV